MTPTLDLASQYIRQYAWRTWAAAYGALPQLQGASILDLGCAIGDQAKYLAEHGARVLGIDDNPELIAHASRRGIVNAEFRVGDVRHPEVAGHFDGIWASFVPAYFPDFGPVLAAWRERLRPSGFMALVEVSGFFAHEPLAPACRDFLQRYAQEAARTGRYDFDMGSKLVAHVESAKLKTEVHLVLSDAELSFIGAAPPDVLQAWTNRLDRMQLLLRRAEVEYPAFRSEWLACLARPEHVSRCEVHFVLARRPSA